MPIPAGDGSGCEHCGLNTYKRYTHHVAPPILTVFVAHTTTTPNEGIQIAVDGHAVHYKIVGVMYYGHSHFTSRFVDEQRRVWYNDGIQLGRWSLLEGYINGVDMTRDSAGKKPDILKYRRVDL
ncbi:hypothetical protein EV421DRAFT_1722703 [Armillaria borealis]|uniref:Uncharacterized protein n=1 Tax=Armillaria borealis TaxID=47425 RepID=A0AA39ISS7_9AGAR|nr:hypothetical protein EV421DRAFT_1722703 [Armillaria borealis]